MNPLQLSTATAAGLDTVQVLHQLSSAPSGLSDQESAARLAMVGPNAVLSHKASAWGVLGRQLASPILVLLFVTASVSLFLGDATNSIVIGGILLVSVGLGFSNEFRAERASESLHSQISHRALVLREGRTLAVDVTNVVPGDVVQLGLGTIVPADLRLLETNSLLCDESILTGESLPTEKDPSPVLDGVALGDRTSCAFMGTVVHSGGGTGVVVATGRGTEFGRIASGMGERQPQTEFQLGLRRFSFLLLQVALGLTTLIFIINVLLQRPIIESLLFSLAIAVGITPQLLPAVVSTSLATGTRVLAKQKVLVKRLVCIEDLGDMDILVTDKTGTLTEGRISYTGALPVGPETTQDQVLTLGLLATEADYTAAKDSVAGQNPLDGALWTSLSAARLGPEQFTRLDLISFDHDRRRTSVLVRHPAHGEQLITKGAPEDVLSLCRPTTQSALETLDEQFGAGSRVVAVAYRDVPGLQKIRDTDERDFTLAGFLIFLDRPKANVKASLDHLQSLQITVKIATGDNAKVAEKVCAEIGIVSGGTLNGADIDGMSDENLVSAARTASIFARVSPEHKARIITALRKSGGSVGFLGDGVNDALALHKADIGISVDTATDVAKDAADIILLDKDLGVLAAGVGEGRRIFANTIKYVLMGTSSNFGNMFSAATASAVLNFLPMLPSQILLNNLLYDAGQLAIPTDRVDKEQLRAPTHWNIAFIRRFMLLFGPISSIFDFATFTLMLTVFTAVPGEFRAGWFIESIATQTLIIFAIRTRKVPFFRSRPSAGLTVASLGVVAVGVALPLSPLGPWLGFDPLPVPFFLALLSMVIIYLVMVEFAKHWFFSRSKQESPAMKIPRRRSTHHISRRASRFTTAGKLSGAPKKTTDDLHPRPAKFPESRDLPGSREWGF
ncbi:magnesium-translocating P-type ATPase [Paenarthrobacter ilicis]|nr:magnesium-translocating P-type ATPase [Paenarthrobacter ilicis]